MNSTNISIRSAARYLLSWLVVIALLMTVLPVMAQGPDEQPGEPPDETAKRAPPVRGEGRPVPTKDRAIISEDFEAGVMPPAGWTHLQTNPNETWQIGTYNPYNGIYHGHVLYDPALLDQDEVLLSPTFTADSGDLSLWSKGSLYWCRDTYDNCDLEVWFVNGTWDWGGGDDVYLGVVDGDWTATWAWSYSTFDFSSYASGNPARIAFRYVGNDGAEIGVDQIDINYSIGGACADPHEPNDAPGQATPISYGITLTDPDICPAGDEDYYSFVGSAGDPIAVDIDAWAIGSSLDPVLHLYDTDGVTELAYNDDYDGLDSYLEYTLPANGTYYLKVRDWGTPHGGPDYFYTISLTGGGGRNVALISDQTELQAITSILDSMGLTYDVVNDNWDGTQGIYTSDYGFLSNYGVVVWYASGYTIGRNITQQEHDALELYLQAGGRLLVTGYDTLGSPSDSLLADLVRSSDYGDGPFTYDYTVTDGSHPITDGPYGSFPAGTALTTAHSDHDQAEADTSRGATTVAELSDGHDKIIATELASDGIVVYWNGNYNVSDWTGVLAPLQEQDEDIEQKRDAEGRAIGALPRLPELTAQPEEGFVVDGAPSDTPPPPLPESAQGELRPQAGPVPQAVTTINFDDGSQPCSFNQTVALRNEYQAMGVIFDGPGGNDGGAILDQCGNFSVSGHSPPNFLAFNASAPLSDGGIPTDPEEITFVGTVSFVQVNAGSNSGSGQTLTMEAFEAGGNPLGSDTITLSPALQPLTVSASGIKRVVISSPASVFVLDDLTFDTESGGGSNADLLENTLHWLTGAGGVGQAQWTFMVYLDGDNNLEGAGIDDFMEMSSVGSNSDVNILVQFDRIPGYDSSYGDWTSTKRFRVTNGMEPTSGSALQDIGEANMGDPLTLIDFVQWGMTTYPADQYAVVVWDHGSGWRLRPEDMPLLKDVAWDDTNGGDALDMPELLYVMDILSSGGLEPLDLVGFDACLMSMIEVDNQLIPYADVRVGSEETEPWDGWPYDDILTVLVGGLPMSAGQLGTVIVDEYYASYGNSQTQSAVDLHTPYGDLNTAVNDFAVALINGVCAHYADIATARANTQEFGYPTYIDLYDFAYQVNLEVSDAAINAAATAVINAVNGAVIHEQHGAGWSGAHGISIYFPESEFAYDSSYDGDTGWLQFTADTQWDEWLNTFYTGCPTGDIVWCDDMESGVNGWAADGFWHQVEDGVSPYPESHSPTHSWWYGQDATGDYDNGTVNAGSLTSPAITIPSGASIAFLNFWSWYETETSGTSWDQRWVQISVDGGSFQDLAQLSGDPMQTWVNHVFDLSPYIGSQVRIRLHFDTMDGLYNGYRGWYIDDVCILADEVPPPAALRVEPDDQIVSSGTFHVDVVVENVAHLGAFQFDLVYDPSVIEFVSADLGPFLGSTGCDTMEAETHVPGRLTYGGHIVGTCFGPNGGGAVATVTFDPIAEGESALILENEQLLTSDDPPGPITPVELYHGHVTVSPCFFADVDPYPPNCDNDVDIADIYAVAYRFGCVCGDPCYDAIYDLNSNCYISSIDIQIAACYFGYPTGDFTSCYTPTGLGKEAAEDEGVRQDLTVWIEPPVTTLAGAGEVFTITVDVANANDLGAFNFELGYDSTIVQVDGVSLGDTLESMGFTPDGPIYDTGKVTYGAHLLHGSGFDGSGTLAAIRLETLRVGSSVLDLENVEVANTGGITQTLTVQDGNVDVVEPGISIYLPIIQKNYP